jgi:peroxiredoxin Q/BCP
MPLPTIGSIAPALSLPDQNGKIHSLVDYSGKWVLLYFYPKDDTPGCTKEACAIRDVYANFDALHAVVLGVSTDSSESHTQFAEKYHLPFTLLADTEKKVTEAYGVEKRTSFLIRPDGTIAKVYESVEPEKHAEEVLNDIKELLKN